MAEKTYYISWVDQRTDPWPQWESLHAAAQAKLGGQPVRFLSTDHAQWPGLPLVEGIEVPKVSDGRMGQYPWPGISLTVEGRPSRLYTGPTITALFHPESRFLNLAGLDGVFLLHLADRPGGPDQLLHNVLMDLCRARAVPDPAKRLRLVPLQGISDPTDHAGILRSIESWLKRDDPFGFGGRRLGKTVIRIVVNLSPGSPAMHACWLMLRWNGALGGPESVVEFVQGSGSLEVRPADGGPASEVLREVPVDVLSRLGNQDIPAKPLDDAVRLDDLTLPPFDELRQKIDHAAMLGLPILLQGERGTGKTFLAQYYHRRRQWYRQRRGPAATSPAREKVKKSASPVAERDSEGNFVTVTLSEYADVETLRDTLFGWAKGSWTGADKAFDGLLGEANGGTLFLDEIHHLEKALQAALLGPLNCHRYRPKMATYELTSDFDLVVATNDPNWRKKTADDFRDRVERIVLEVPSFRSFQRHGAEVIWRFWEFTWRRRCNECGIDPTDQGDGWPGCREQLLSVFKRHPLPGNWRDLQRLADNVLLHLTAARDGRPAPVRWNRDQLEHAIGATFGEG